MAMSETTKKHPSKHPTCIKRVHLWRQFLGSIYTPAILRRQEWTQPGGHLPDSGENPHGPIASPSCDAWFSWDESHGGLVVSFFWGGYSSPVNWKLVQTQQSTNFERFQKTKDKEEKKSPKEYPQPTHRLELLGYCNQKKAESIEINGSSDPSSYFCLGNSLPSPKAPKFSRPTHHSPPELQVFRIGPPHFPSSVVPFCGKAVGPWRVPMYSTGTSEK